MIRRLFIASWILSACVVAALVGRQAGPDLEGRFAPIRGEQSVQVVERTGPTLGLDGKPHGGRVCWAWTFTKLRHSWSDNIDAFLRVNGQPGGVTAPYERDSGRPWGIEAFAVAPRPEPYTLTYCVELAPYVTLADAIEVKQTAFYRGWNGLWTLAVPFPVVVSPGVTPPG